MENIFKLLIEKLLEVGFYDLLIFIIALTIFYAIFKKFKLLGESPVINGVLAFSIAFLIFGFPVILNYSLVLPMATFLTQTFLFLLVFLVGFMAASFFYPDLPKFLAEKFTSRSMLSIGITIGIAVAILSGMFNLLFITPSAEETTAPLAPREVSTLAAGIIIFVILILVAGAVALQTQ